VQHLGCFEKELLRNHTVYDKSCCMFCLILRERLNNRLLFSISDLLPDMDYRATPCERCSRIHRLRRLRMSYCE
jgi:hypothetical protein